MFKTTPRMDDDICMSGQKFVLNTASGVRRQFMFIYDKVYLAFITKGKKFTDCSTFLDITYKVRFQSIFY